MYKYLNPTNYIKGFFRVYKFLLKIANNQSPFNEIDNLRSELNKQKLLLNKERLLNLKNKYKGKRCFIIGNGPSLKKQNLSILENEYCFVSNWFTLNPVYKSLKSVFHFFGDPHFITEEKFVPNFTEKIVSNKNVKVFTDQAFFQITQQDKNLKGENTFFLEINHEEKVWEGHFHTDITKKLHWGRSVVIDYCIPAAIHMGFNEIYLLGCDCDYSGGKFKNSYFYNLDELPTENRKNLEELEKVDPPSAFENTFIDSYQVVKKSADKNFVQIFNSTYGGKLEVFERKELNSLF